MPHWHPSLALSLSYYVFKFVADLGAWFLQRSVGDLVMAALPAW